MLIKEIRETVVLKNTCHKGTTHIVVKIKGKAQKRLLKKIQAIIETENKSLDREQISYEIRMQADQLD